MQAEVTCAANLLKMIGYSISNPKLSKLPSCLNLVRQQRYGKVLKRNQLALQQPWLAGTSGILAENAQQSANADPGFSSAMFDFKRAVALYQNSFHLWKNFADWKCPGLLALRRAHGSGAALVQDLSKG